VGKAVILFKAVSEIEGEYYSLGMAHAQVIHLPRGEWIEGGPYGIHASRIKSHARKVVYYARQRKVLPVPPNMIIVSVQGVVREYRGKFSVVCDKIYIN